MPFVANPPKALYKAAGTDLVENTIVVIAPNGPYVIAANYSIDDSQGNNNGIADFDEDILFHINTFTLHDRYG